MHLVKFTNLANAIAGAWDLASLLHYIARPFDNWEKKKQIRTLVSSVEMEEMGRDCRSCVSSTERRALRLSLPAGCPLHASEFAPGAALRPPSY